MFTPRFFAAASPKTKAFNGLIMNITAIKEVKIKTEIRGNWENVTCCKLPIDQKVNCFNSSAPDHDSSTEISAPTKLEIINPTSRSEMLDLTIREQNSISIPKISEPKIPEAINPKSVEKNEMPVINVIATNNEAPELIPRT